MEKTPMMKLVEQLKELKNDCIDPMEKNGVRLALTFALESLSEERRTIESAYSSGETKSYWSADHYYFMNYITND